MSLDKMTDEIITSLGIPKRIFEGESNVSGFHLELLTEETRRLDRLREKFSKVVIQPMVEKFIPEAFWETAWICSPRGRVMKLTKRAAPRQPS